ncbi:unnamed protein product, partial [Prorocentrum cordatum]
ELHARLSEAEALPTAPSGRRDPNEQLFNAHAWCSWAMLAALELPDVPFHVLLSTHRAATALQGAIAERRAPDAKTAPERRRSTPAAPEVCEVLKQFDGDPCAQHLKQDWLLKAFKIPEARRRDARHFAELFNAATEDFCLRAKQRGITATPLSKRILATCTIFRLLLTSQKPPKAFVLRFGPALRLLANYKGDCGMRYAPRDARGADVELAANGLLAYFTRLADSVAQLVSSSASNSGARPVGAPDLVLPVASPPVMCWICGEGFTRDGAFFKRCSDARGGCAEYRKRPLWRARQGGVKPLLPWVKRRILQSATFHLTFSVPGSLSLHWNRPEAIAVAKARCEEHVSFRVLLLGNGQEEALQSGLTGNRILISQASATLAVALPPSSTRLKDSIVVIFGQDTDDLRKCQLLTAQREAYKALAAQRARVDAIFAEIPVGQAAVNALPLNGVPRQFLDCAAQMPEVERCGATRSGLGTVRHPSGAARPEGDVSDELSESDGDERAAT